MSSKNELPGCSSRSQSVSRSSRSIMGDTESESESESVGTMSRLYPPAKSTTESFISAIESFDVDTVESLLKRDFENAEEIIGNCRYSNYSMLQLAVEQIDPDEDSNKHLNLLHRSEAFLRIIKVLLKSGRFNVNGIAHYSYTALHIAAARCTCRLFSSDDYKDLVNDIIELLLKNNANINVKTSNGETPLMKASEHGCSHSVKLLLNWKDELGAGVDLNARDIHGETALIKAAKWARVDVVELLLQHGCLDEFQDHRGFYALHSVIYGLDLINNASKDFFALSGVLASEEMLVVLKRYASHSERGYEICRDWPGYDSIQDTVSMLVTRGQSKINCLDFNGNTVLDLALKSKLFISQNTVEKLMEYGATSSDLLNKHPEYQDITLQYTDKLGKTPLHRLSAVLPELTLREKVEFLMHRLNSSPHKEAFEEMAIAKDHRGRTVLHYAVMTSGIPKSLASDGIGLLLLINVLKLKRTINETDKYGRTPLHYCEYESVYESLVEQGANEHMQDIDGKTPRDLNKLRNEEYNRPYFSYKFKPLFGSEEWGKIDAWMIWSDSEYAYRDHFSKKICPKVRQFMNRLSEGIRKKDPRFECQPVLIGSAEERTKIGQPDEFDFNFILTKLGKQCEVVPTPEAPSGFVHLKRKSINDEFGPENQHFKSENNFARLFNSDGFLLTADIASRFTILYLQVMSEPEFWVGEDFFEWDPCSEVGMIYDKQLKEYHDTDEFRPSTHPCSNIQLKLNRPIEGRYMFTLISLDIVPCIKINGWWPEEGLSGVNGDITIEGCHLVFDRPQRICPWVPFSDPFARISFAPAEGRMIKESSAMSRAAYMVGKQLIRNQLQHTYVLKTCLLYCIEALKDCTSNNLLYEDIKPAELRCFVEKLMLCFHEFHLQDFLPCYLMPSFHLPIYDYLKSKHDNLPHDDNFTNNCFFRTLFSSLCTTESAAHFCHRTLDPLCEKFNREELLRQLSLDRAYIEHQRLQQKSLATGQTVRSDSQSESSVRLSIKRKKRVQLNANKTYT